LKSQNRMRVPLSRSRRKHRTSIIQKRILACIDEALKELGASVAEALYYYLENNFRLSRNKIPRKPKTFMESIKFDFWRGRSEIY